MSQPRKSAVQTKAREQARKHGAEIARRHEQLTTLAEEYHAAQIEADHVLAEAQRKANEVIAEGKAAVESSQQRSAATAQKMLDTGEPARAVAERLGLTNAALRKLTATPNPDTSDAPADEGKDDTTAAKPENYAAA